MSGDDLSRVLEAVGTTLFVLGLAYVVDRGFAHRGGRIAHRITGRDLDPVLETRLRFVRRLIAATILVIGGASVLTQFTPLDQFAASILASGAIAAAVIGFAAQQSLGNVIAGVLIAVTQPIRIGDAISFEGYSGVVEDIRLTHTFLQTGVDARVVVPNGRLAQTILRNDSIVTATVGVEVELWLSHESDELRALEAIREAIDEAEATIKSVTSEGTTIGISGPHAAPAEREARRGELLRDALRALRNAGLR